MGRMVLVISGASVIALAALLAVAAAPPSQAQPVPSVSLQPGWNSVVYGGATLPLEQALSNCLPSVDAVFMWDPGRQAYRWWFKGAPAGINTLSGLGSGAVLMVRAVAACSWVQPAGSPAPTPTPTSTTEFTPCQGRPTASELPPGADPARGPWTHRVMIATSQDGRHFARNNLIFADRASVPGVVTVNGKVYVYFMTFCPGVLNEMAVAISDDGLSSWTYKIAKISGTENWVDPVDPSVIYDEGVFRLYFTSGGPRVPAGP